MIKDKIRSTGERYTYVHVKKKIFSNVFIIVSIILTVVVVILCASWI